ncbi:MAG: Mov34/MPN/PAD-1 family protein [Candidatus Njordarchaeales archaeon]
MDTDAFYKDGSPHAFATSIDYYTQEQVGSVEFDYQKIYEREDKYHDIIGFYHTHPSGMNFMSQTDVETMTQWVKCLGKSLSCLIETDSKLNGWIFFKNNGKVEHREIYVQTRNDVNYDMWLDPHGAFWNPVDFLLDNDIIDEETQEDNLYDDVKQILQLQQDMLNKIEKL